MLDQTLFPLYHPCVSLCSFTQKKEFRQIHLPSHAHGSITMARQHPCVSLPFSRSLSSVASTLSLTIRRTPIVLIISDRECSSLRAPRCDFLIVTHAFFHFFYSAQVFSPDIILSLCYIWCIMSPSSCHLSSNICSSPSSSSYKPVVPVCLRCVSECQRLQALLSRPLMQYDYL